MTRLIWVCHISQKSSAPKIEGFVLGVAHWAGWLVTHVWLQYPPGSLITSGLLWAGLVAMRFQRVMSQLLSLT
jgi:hypothetical protein